jgi:CubicO group peptidase (beta-lactamase class C family)
MSRLVVPSLFGLIMAVPIVWSPDRSPQGSDPNPRSIDSIFARYDHTDRPGCALGVFRAGRIVYSRGYGMAELNQGVPIRPTTVFYIASTSKQFAAFSIALLAEEGRVSLDDPVRKWVPELPSYADSITIRNLVHHSSGIRDYLGLWSMSGRSVADEIPQEVGLDLIVRQRALDFEPGTRYSYSNSGYLLLSEIVKRASGASLRQYSSERIFQPLGMAETHFHDDNAMIVPRRAEGYQPIGAGRYQIVRTSFALVGDGGLLTTIEDLAKWDGNFYQNRLGRGGQGLIDQVTTVGRFKDGRPMNYAFGLQPGRYRGLAMIEHGGSFIGFRAQLIRFPTERLSVAVLCNDYTAAPEQLARQVADRYLGDRMTPVSAAPVVTSSGISVPAARLERWVGNYEVMPGTVVRVTRDSSGLWLAAFGQRFRLIPKSDSVFTTAGLPGELEFRNGPALVVAGVGATTPAPKLAPPPVVAPAELAGYAGRYRSEELDTWATLEARADSLRIRVRWSGWRALDPLARDVFTMPGTQIAFDRGRRGEITGFRLSAARTLNVRFERLADRP